MQVGTCQLTLIENELATKFWNWSKKSENTATQEEKPRESQIIVTKKCFNFRIV